MKNEKTKRRLMRSAHRFVRNRAIRKIVERMSKGYATTLTLKSASEHPWQPVISMAFEMIPVAMTIGREGAGVQVGDSGSQPLVKTVQKCSQNTNPGVQWRTLHESLRLSASAPFPSDGILGRTLSCTETSWIRCTFKSLLSCYRPKVSERNPAPI